MAAEREFLRCIRDGADLYIAPDVKRAQYLASYGFLEIRHDGQHYGKPRADGRRPLCGVVLTPKGLDTLHTTPRTV